MDREKILEDFEYAVRKSHGEGLDYVDGLTTADGFKILQLLKEQEEDIQDLRRENHNILTQFHEWAKEQKAVKPVRDKETGRIWLCGNCGTYVGFEDNDPGDPNEFDKYCRECGRPVLWEG